MLPVQPATHVLAAQGGEVIAPVRHRGPQALDIVANLHGVTVGVGGGGEHASAVKGELPLVARRVDDSLQVACRVKVIRDDLTQGAHPVRRAVPRIVGVRGNLAGGVGDGAQAPLGGVGGGEGCPTRLGCILRGDDADGGELLPQRCNAVFREVVIRLPRRVGLRVDH